MGQIIDLNEFRLITKGKKDLERMLFDDFISVSESNLIAMIQAMKSGDADLWRENAHMMKGACRNLGASELANMLQDAEKCLPEERPDRYGDIVMVFADVRDFLEKEASR